MGKSSSITIGYWYYVAFHHGLTIGPIDAFLAMAGAKKIAWEGELTASGAVSINKPYLWGGEKDQGGMVGTLRVMMGEADQTPNAYLVAAFGNQTTSWRGFCTVAWEGGKYGAMNPWPQKPSYKIRTIKAMWDDGDCWYPATAAIPLASETEVIPGATDWEYQIIDHIIDASDPDAIEIPAAGWNASAPAPFGRESTSGTLVPAIPIATFWGYNTSLWLRKELDLSGQGSLAIEGYVENAAIFFLDGVMFASVNLDNSQSAEPSGIPYSVSVPAVAGHHTLHVLVLDELDGPPEPSPEDLDLNDNTYFYGQISAAFAKDTRQAMNPAHMLVFARTQRELGREALANINSVSATAAADWFYLNGFGLCTKRPAATESPAAFERRICTVSGCSFTRSLVDGQWYIDIANGEFDLETLPVLTDDDVLSFKEVPLILDDAINSVSVRYFDVEKKQHVTTPPIRAMGLVMAFGEIHKTYEFPEIPDGAIAVRVAARELANSTEPKRTFDLTTTRSTYSWRPNQYFRLQLPKRGIADMVCLVGELQHGQLRSGAIKLKATQEPATLPARVPVEIEPGVDTRPSQTPVAITTQTSFEAPYVEVVAAMSRADLAVLPDETGYLVGVAVDPASSRDFTMMVAPSGGTYAELGSGDFCPTALVVETAGPAEEDFTLSDAQRLQFVDVGSPALWDNEICRVDAIDLEAGTISLGRGCADTVPPEEHSAGGRLWFYGQGAAADTTEYTDGETVDVKLLTNTGSQQLAEAEAAALSVTFDQRQARPYPPGLFQINSESYPEAAVGELTVTWAHRDRELQADQLVDQSAASIGPEVGTTYTVRYYLDDVLRETESGISGESATPYTIPGDGTARIELESVRDELVSRYCHSWSFAYTSELPFDAETTTWESRIVSLGSSVTGPEKDIADELIKAIKASAYGAKIVYLLPFIGSSIAAHRVPLRDTLNVGAASNGGASPFTDSDCDTATGLVNSSGKAAFLDTGIKPSELGVSNNGGMGWWERDWGAGSGVQPMGCYSTTNSPDQRFVLDLRASLQRFRWGGVSNAAGPATSASNGHYYGQRSSSSLRRIYKDGVTLGSDNTVADAAASAIQKNIYVAGCQLNGGALDTWDGRGACAYLTDGTLSDAEVADFHTLLDTYLITPTGR